jgi:hypothetical protein
MRSPQGNSGAGNDTGPARWSQQSDYDQRVVRRPPRSLGFTGGSRPHRREMTLEKWRIQIRAEHESAHPGEPALSEWEVDVEADRRLKRQLANVHPYAYREYVRTAPTLRRVNRDRVVPIREERATLALPEAAELDKRLRVTALGRRTDRDMPVAVYKRMAFGAGRPEIRRVLRELSDPEHHSLQRAYGHPLLGQSGTSEPAVGRTLKAMLDRNDPVALLDSNVRALRRLRELGYPDIGRRLVVDGTPISSPRPDRQGYSAAERRLIANGLGADLGKHGGDDRQDKIWHGWTLLILVDLASTLPLVWMLVPASHREHPHASELLDLLLDRWPECAPEVIAGDREYDVEGLCWTLEASYGVHPCFSRRDEVAHEYRWAQTEGVPQCARHGAMKLEQAEGFVGGRKRLALGLVPGEEADLSGARMRWVCVACSARATTRPQENPRLYTYLPHGGAHPRVGLRAALLHRRNAVESVNDSLKDRIGHGGAHSCKWLSSDRQVQWLVGGIVLGQTLRALAHESGLYEELADEVRRGALGPREHRAA